jgi:hypothetical protein
MLCEAIAFHVANRGDFQMCYCQRSDNAMILNDLKAQTIPDGALVSQCCWRRISQVRGRTFRGSEKTPAWDPDGEIWKALCRKRGHLLQPRLNPGDVEVKG